MQVVTISKARRFLNEGGHHYTQDSILQSELRILKTLNFHVTDPSTLVYIETILEILGKLAKQIKFLEILGKLAKQIKFPYHIAHFLAHLT